MREGLTKREEVFERQFDWGSSHLKSKDGLQGLGSRGIMIRDGRSWESDNSSGYRYVGHSEPSKEMGKLGGKRIKATPGITG